MKPSDLISDSHRDLNRQMHADPRGFGQSGRKHAAAVLDWALETECEDILDYGCGAGTLKAALSGRWLGKVREYDPAVTGREKLPKPADLVVCTDVLEHVEPGCLLAVMEHQRSLARVAGYVSIACQPAHKLLPDGRNAHLIVEAPEFWITALRTVGWFVVTRRDRFNPEGIADVTFELRVPPS